MRGFLGFGSAFARNDKVVAAANPRLEVETWGTRFQYCRTVFIVVL